MNKKIKTVITKNKQIIIYLAFQTFFFNWQISQFLEFQSDSENTSCNSVFSPHNGIKKIKMQSQY